MADNSEIAPRLSVQLVLLERIWDDFLRNSELKVASLRLDAWQKRTKEILSDVGKAETLHAISELVTQTVNDPVSQFLELAKRYRLFLSTLVKQMENADSREEKNIAGEPLS